MKRTLKHLLALMLAIVMLLSLGTAAFADGEEAQTVSAGDGQSVQTIPEPSTPAQTVAPITVALSLANVELKSNEKVKVKATVKDEGKDASYKWYSTDEKVAKVSGEGKTATVTAVGAGRMNVALTVESKDGRSAYGYLEVRVLETVAPVAVKGGASVNLDEGGKQTLSAKVSGGSGAYEYKWDTDGSGVIVVENQKDSAAEIYAGRAGSGAVILTVFDTADRTNNASTQWTVAVADKPLVAPELTISRGTVDLGAGAGGTLQLSATGGSGDYEYIWRSDNAGVVSVSGSGATAEIKAADTIIPGSNRAEISASVRDKQSGLMSNTVSCVVTVSGGTASFSGSENAEAGNYADFGVVAEKVAAAFKKSFGSTVSGGASVRFTNPSGKAGSLTFQDGTPVKSGTSYTFDIFRTLVFHAEDAGEFSTAYIVSDGGNTMEGTLSYTVTGAVPVTSVTMDKTAIRMPTFSNESLTITVTPSIGCSVEWKADDPYLVILYGSGNKIRLESNGNSGTTNLTATVTDSNGKKTSATCAVTVYSTRTKTMQQAMTYDTSLTVTLGAEDSTAKLAESMISKFRSAYGTYPSNSDTILFTGLGNTRYGSIRARDGSVVLANRTYTFSDWIDMYFLPVAAGVYTANYRFTHGSKTAEGTIRITVQASSVTVVMAPSMLRMSPYSSQYITLNIQPLSTVSRVQWSSSDTSVATVSGSNATAIVNSLAAGTATITAAVTDNRGVVSRRSCTVLVGTESNTFNPTVSTTLGIPYIGTGTSSAMRSQFASLYNVTLPDSAIIRFASTGNNDVAVMRLADGSAIRANTDYTLGQYVKMYTQPISAGTFSVPYTLSYSGKELNGTVSVFVSAASISTDLKLPKEGNYSFSDRVGSSTGGNLLAESIRNTIGANWSYIRFSSSSDGTGTLYANSSRSPITASTDITAASMTQLYFVPGNQPGTFSAPYTVYTSTGSVIAAGSLNLIRSGISGFTDVPSTSYYAQAVQWAVGKGVTSGTAATLFSPNMIVTRGQAVTFLWRAAGQPKATTAANPFADVKTDAYYYDAVLWAVQQGITNGTGETTFSPDAQLQRDQLLTFLCRASGSYADGPNWSQMAVNWATSHGLLSGVPGEFTATAACPRSDVVYYLWKNYTA